MTKPEIEQLLEGTAPGRWQYNDAGHYPETSFVLWYEIYQLDGDGKEADLVADSPDKNTAKLIAAAPALAAQCLSQIEEIERLKTVLDEHDLPYEIKGA